MAVTFYRYDDASAPVLNGTADSLITLLDAILVTGYGAKSPAGWTKPYTGTNKAVFRMASTLGARGTYIRLVEGTDTNRTVNYRIYGSMTSVDAGTNVVPRADQVSGGNFFCIKSTTSDATARPWFCVADEKGFFLYWDYTGTTSIGANGAQNIYVAQVEPRAVSDPGPVLVMPSLATTVASTSTSRLGNTSYLYTFGSAGTTVAHWMTHNFFNAEGSFACGKASKGWMCSQSIAMDWGNQPPDPATGELLMVDFWLYESNIAANGVWRGRVPYLAAFGHGSSSLAQLSLSTIAGLGALSGKSYMVVPLFNSGGGTTYYGLMQTAGDR